MTIIPDRRQIRNKNTVKKWTVREAPWPYLDRKKLMFDLRLNEMQKFIVYISLVSGGLEITIGAGCPSTSIMDAVVSAAVQSKDHAGRI